MIKKILGNFILDKAAFTVFYFLNSILVILFFYLSLGQGVEVAYPIVISLFVYIILILLEWSRYYKFNSRLEHGVKNIHYDLQPATQEQKEVSGLVSQIHFNYTNRILELNNAHKNQRHFFSQWIHNMKTPISVIDLILQKWQSASEGPESLLEMRESIKEENDKLANYLEQVLNILRLDDFSKDYVPEAIDLAAAVRKAVNSRKNQFIYANVFPKMQFGEEKVLVLSDGKWNDVLLDQILSNAIKYSQSPGESKNVYFSIEKKENITLLEIRDEGVGIPAQDLRRVFEPFFTGENGRKYKNASGIGLYICSVIAQKLGHEITVQSREGHGTSVKISYLSKM